MFVISIDILQLNIFFNLYKGMVFINEKIKKNKFSKNEIKKIYK
jgi:hypothetical protein